MPALRLFGRRWHISSDDLPPFTLPGAAFHYTWAVFLAAALAIEPGTCSPSPSSPDEGGGSGSTASLRGFLAAMLAVDVLQACALAWLTLVGLRGEWFWGLQVHGIPGSWDSCCLALACTVQCAVLQNSVADPHGEPLEVSQGVPVHAGAVRLRGGPSGSRASTGILTHTQSSVQPSINQ